MLTGHRKIGAWLARSLGVLCGAPDAASLILGLLNGRPPSRRWRWVAWLGDLSIDFSDSGARP